MPLAVGILIQIGLAGGLGLVAVAVSIFVSVRFGRRISAESPAKGRPRPGGPTAARGGQRLRRGEDVRSEVPELHYGSTTEIVSVGEAFSSVQRTAVEAAVGQAHMREGLNKVFVSLARRNQSLLHRQLAMLEAMEQRATDPETLEDLFGLDHLTTRMRRHSEGLIILSGSTPGRGWRVPVTIYDVVRTAVEEVEDYLRVAVSVPQGPAVIGTVVTDVIHLIAELVENAAVFSPPHTSVRVNGQLVANGYAIEVEDRGLGIPPDDMAGSTSDSPSSGVRPGRQRPARPVRRHPTRRPPQHPRLPAFLPLRRHHGDRAPAERTDGRNVHAPVRLLGRGGAGRLGAAFPGGHAMPYRSGRGNQHQNRDPDRRRHRRRAAR